MNSWSKTLADYISRFEEKFRCKPKLLPITPCEAKVMMEGAENYYKNADPCSPNQIFNIEAWQSPWADMARERALKLSPNEFWLISTASAPLAAYSEWRDTATESLHCKLAAYIMADITEIKLNVECDALGWLKRKLHIEKWWPVKKQEFTVQGTVLYPFLQVQMPYEKHVVKLELK